jgi:uncharacterized repeat protein (TIGR02543 family)
MYRLYCTTCHSLSFLPTLQFGHGSFFSLLSLPDSFLFFPKKKQVNSHPSIDILSLWKSKSFQAKTSITDIFYKEAFFMTDIHNTIPYFTAGHEGYESEVPETDVSRDGFEFKGWSLSAVASESEYDTGSKLDDFGEDTVLYAVWDTDGDTDYTVTVHIQNADKTYKETRKETHYADYGTSVTYLENTDFEVPNYYHVDVAKSELTITAGEDDGIDIWLARNKASLIYDLNAADATTQEELSKVTDIWGTEITLDSIMPERENYVFKGWSLDAESDDVVSSAVISPTGITVYAVWVEKNAVSMETPAPTVEPTETPIPTETPSQTPAATETPAVTEEPTPAPTSSASSTPKPENVTKTTTDTLTPPDTLNTSAKDGSSQLKKGNVIYKVSGKSAVAYRAAKKTVKKVTILNKVKIDGKNYNVTSISKNAFKGCKKLKSVNIKAWKLTSIGKNAFSGCKKLKTITIKSLKLKKVGKNAFKGISKKAAFKVPKKKIKAYKKLMAKKSTGYKKTMKIKK